MFQEAFILYCVMTGTFYFMNAVLAGIRTWIDDYDRMDATTIVKDFFKFMALITIWPLLAVGIAVATPVKLAIDAYKDSA